MKKYILASVADCLEDLSELSDIETLAIKDMGFEHIGFGQYAIMQNNSLIVYSNESRNFIKYFYCIDLVDGLLHALINRQTAQDFIEEHGIETSILEFKDLFME